MNNITCDICQDLMPLVKDGIASEDSTKAVKDHLKTCPACSKLYQNENIEVKNIDDHRILTQIRKRLYLASLITAFIGALIGLVLTGGAGLFYNILIMPTIGII
ncbi:MAG: zf-HC2 domain-containing protein, partial [Clostridium sp.]|nr:zf-HC2 domain-containing protein [Clostridium sp.]